MNLRENCGDLQVWDGERILPKVGNKDMDEEHFR
jgi:hypothetical protein